MAWEFDNSVPIYLQLIDGLKMKIISGTMKPGEKIPSVRDLAEEAGVNPNTMQRALSELERDSLIFSVRTSGRYVTEDDEMIQQMKNEIASHKIDLLFESLFKMGFTKKEISDIFLNELRKDELNG